MGVLFGVILVPFLTPSVVGLGFVVVGFKKDRNGYASFFHPLLLSLLFFLYIYSLFVKVLRISLSIWKFIFWTQYCFLLARYICLTLQTCI